MVLGQTRRMEQKVRIKRLIKALGEALCDYLRLVIPALSQFLFRHRHARHEVCFVCNTELFKLLFQKACAVLGEVDRFIMLERVNRVYCGLLVIKQRYAVIKRKL